MLFPVSTDNDGVEDATFFTGVLRANEPELVVTFEPSTPIAPTAVPTMTEWGMIIFLVLAGMGAVYSLRRRSSIQR